MFVSYTSTPSSTSANWRNGGATGYLPPDADTEAVAATLLSLMLGMIVMHHVVDDVPADALRTGVALLGAATRTRSAHHDPCKADHTMTDIDLSTSPPPATGPVRFAATWPAHRAPVRGRPW